MGMTYGQLFMELNPNIKAVENGTCVWIYFDNVNHDTFRTEWWNKEIHDDVLKTQEPRVMTITEAFDAEVAWLERYANPDDGVEPIIQPVIIRYYENGYWQCLIEQDESADLSLFLDGFGTEFRFWTSKPTDEQREAVKWE